MFFLFFFYLVCLRFSPLSLPCQRRLSGPESRKSKRRIMETQVSARAVQISRQSVRRRSFCSHLMLDAAFETQDKFKLNIYRITWQNKMHQTHQRGEWLTAVDICIHQAFTVRDKYIYFFQEEGVADFLCQLQVDGKMVWARTRPNVVQLASYTGNLPLTCVLGFGHVTFTPFAGGTCDVNFGRWQRAISQNMTVL